MQERAALWRPPSLREQESITTPDGTPAGAADTEDTTAADQEAAAAPEPEPEPEVCPGSEWHPDAENGFTPQLAVLETSTVPRRV